MTSSKKWGVCFLVTPFLGLVLVLAAWAVTSFVIGQMISASPPTYLETSDQSGRMMQLAQPDVRSTAANIINVALGFLGIIFVIMIPVGLLVGIILLAKKDQVQQLPVSNPTDTSPAQGQAPESVEAVKPLEAPTEASATPEVPPTSPTPPETPPTPAV